ncbi:MAG: hypothetical protein IKG09_00320 [Mycoplasmataceae bacterium]|nr:hypothetical protein [Mycoplasmataceae bacterium]
MSKFSKKEIKQKIDNNYQEIISCNEETFQENNQNILQLTIKGTMKKEQNKNEYKPKNQFEALVINQLFNINHRLDNLEQEVSILKQDVSELKQDVNKIKNTPTMKKELLS